MRKVFFCLLIALFPACAFAVEGATPESIVSTDSIWVGRQFTAGIQCQEPALPSAPDNTEESKKSFESSSIEILGEKREVGLTVCEACDSCPQHKWAQYFLIHKKDVEKAAALGFFTKEKMPQHWVWSDFPNS
jgi:hypothetical protein